ncbi:AAA family ATPase [Sphingorhabdus arenilitoris]|uniref:non-specific protein-tyrosine kinase n=1 Tax=Sphingorhabdus arenilitoris TaxID=1490041 RepID=A0ABV8RE80_9SPHN
MNKHSSIKSSGSLLERASELYGFGDALRGGAPMAPPAAEPASPDSSVTGGSVPGPVPGPAPQASPVAEIAPLAAAPTPVQAATPPAYSSRSNRPQQSTRFAKIDRQLLTDGNFIDPTGPVTGLSEEFRIVKRQLLLAARGGKGYEPVEHGERILVCSAHPNEGKTYCSINLALSMASEKDNRVLLVDADFAKPSILATLGIDHSPGLMDALADPNSNAESFVIETDIAGLSVLPAGAQTNQDTEYLAASRTAEIIDDLTRNDPSRIIIFDSPPALAASPASVLALHVGQCLVVVNADETTDSALRDALSLLSGCDHVQLLLNRAKFSPTGRKFGNYYGYGA